MIFEEWSIQLESRPLQDVAVLAVLDFQIPCNRPESPTLYLRSTLTNHEGHERKIGHLR